MRWVGGYDRTRRMAQRPIRTDWHMSPGRWVSTIKDVCIMLVCRCEPGDHGGNVRPLVGGQQTHSLHRNIAAGTRSEFTRRVRMHVDRRGVVPAHLASLLSSLGVPDAEASLVHEAVIVAQLRAVGALGRGSARRKSYTSLEAVVHTYKNTPPSCSLKC